MKIMLQFVVVISLITFFSVDLLSQERTRLGTNVYAGLGLGLTQQKHNDKDFNILNLSIGGETRNQGANFYGEGNSRIGITQLLLEGDYKFGGTFYPTDNGVVGLRAFLLVGSSILPFQNISGGGGVAVQVNLTNNLGVLGEYGYRGTLKIWDINSSQWYISSPFTKVGIVFSGVTN